MTRLKAIWLCLSFGIVVLVAGCASHDSAAKVEAAPGVTPPANIAPPPPPNPPSAGRIAAGKHALAAPAAH